MMACARRSANAADRRHGGDRDGNRGPNASNTTSQTRPTDADQAVPGQTEHSPSGGSPATRIPESSVGKQRTPQPAEAVGGALAANEGSTTETADNPAPKDDSKPEDPRSADRPTTVATPGIVAARHQAAQLAASQQASDGGSAENTDEAAAGDDSSDGSSNGSAPEAAAPAPQPKPAPKPSMMAPRRKLRSRYVPLPNEIWTTTGFQTPFDVGQQYATWWFHHVATEEQRDSAHVLSGGGLPPNVDRPLLQFACESLHEYTLSESQRVSLRNGFHTGIRAILITGED